MIKAEIWLRSCKVESQDAEIQVAESLKCPNLEKCKEFLKISWYKKTKYKWRSSIGDKTKELRDANQKLKDKNDRREKGIDQIANDDVIILWAIN